MMPDRPPWHVRVSQALDGFTYQTMYVHRFALDDPPVVRHCVAQVREQALAYWAEHYGDEHGRVRFHFEWSPDIPDAAVLTAIVPPVGARVLDPGWAGFEEFARRRHGAVDA